MRERLRIHVEERPAFSEGAPTISGLVTEAAILEAIAMQRRHIEYLEQDLALVRARAKESN